MKTIFDELQQEVKNWWISLILGILYVIVAISLMFSPLRGYPVGDGIWLEASST